MRLNYRDLSDLLAAQVRCEMQAEHAIRAAVDYSSRQGDYGAVIGAYHHEAAQMRRAAALIARIRAEHPSSPRRANQRPSSPTRQQPGIPTPPATAGGSL